MKPKNPSLEMSINCSKDRISGLPKHVFQHVLSSCTVNNAVKFCSVSRHWKSLWTSMPSLLFRYEWRQDASDYLRSTRAIDFASFVDKALRLYSAPKVKTFLLDFEFSYKFKDKVDSWLRFAATHEVEELFLIFGAQFYEIRDGWRWTWPWPSLKVLSLVKLRLTQEDIRSIFRGSPLIECLILRMCELMKCEGGCFMIDATDIGLKNLTLESCKIEYEFHQVSENVVLDKGKVEIKAPNLLSLNVVGNMHFTCLKLGDLPALKDAKLCFDMTCSPTWGKMFVLTILEKLRNVERLEVGALIFQVLTVMRLDREICPKFPCKILKINLKISDMYLHGMEVLLHSFPLVEQLFLNVGHHSYVNLDRENYAVEENYWRSKIGSLKCLNQNLEKVEIKGFDARYDSRNLLEVARFFLDNAKVLEKLIIHGRIINMYDPRKNLLEVEENLSHYPRASPNALLVFEVRDFSK